MAVSYLLQIEYHPFRIVVIVDMDKALEFHWI